MLGLIGRKVGMTQVFDERGVLTPVTVVKIEDNVVVADRDEERNGYNAKLVGSIDKKSKNVTKPYSGQFSEGVLPKAILKEMRNFEGDVAIGNSFGVGLLKDLAFVDIEGISKGKGYQGVMKRHGFSGGCAAHGSKFHRGLGGTGMAATPSRTFKGTKMPGRMGNMKTSVQNLRVIRIDEKKQFLMVKGSVPGSGGGIVIVRNATKK